MWTQWVNGLLGIWIIIVPFLSMSPGALRSTLVISGIVIAILGFAGRASSSSVSHRPM